MVKIRLWLKKWMLRSLYLRRELLLNRYDCGYELAAYLNPKIGDLTARMEQLYYECMALEALKGGGDE